MKQQSRYFLQVDIPVTKIAYEIFIQLLVQKADAPRARTTSSMEAIFKNY